MKKIHAQAALDCGKPLELYTYERRSLSPHDAYIEITHCGICHSDVHLIDDDWQTSEYPLIPGHEIVGIVKEVGSQVDNIQVGDRVGIGWQCGSCFRCEWCLQGEENLCFQQQATCMSQPGGFADGIVTDARFAFVLPSSLDSQKTAPLFCGGATVFSPLRRFIHTPTQKVGIIGIGGLGHMALQFANAFGCEVTAFSTSREKEKEAKNLGANSFIYSVDSKSMENAHAYFDLLLATAPLNLDWELYLKLLKPKGVLCIVGAFTQDLKIPLFSLLIGRKSVSSSNIASRPEIKEMLELAARHKIGAITELFSLKDVNQAVQKVKENKVRYRAVLSMQR